MSAIHPMQPLRIFCRCALLLVIVAMSAWHPSGDLAAQVPEPPAQTPAQTVPAQTVPAQNALAGSQPAPSPSVVADVKTFEARVKPFLQKHCIECHGAEASEADLRLDMLAADFLQRPAVDHWGEVLDRLNLGEMPPEEEPRPDPAELSQVIDWITSELTHARQETQGSDGRALLRRLTRLEYANTVRDLLNVEFVEGKGPLEQLPPDGSLAGFDRVSKALLLDPSLMEAYLAVAQQVADQAIVFRPPLVPQRTLRYEFENTAYNGAIAYQLAQRTMELDGEMLVVMDSSARTYGKLRHPYNGKEIPLTGRYRIRVRAAADQGKRGEPIFMDVAYGAEGRQARFRVDATKDAPHIYEFEKTFDAFTPGEFQVGIANGTRFSEGNGEWYEQHNQLTKLAETRNFLESTRQKARMRAEGALDSYVRGSYLPQVLHVDDLPKLYLDWVEVIGPLQGEYPPPSILTVFGSAKKAASFAGASDDRKKLQEDAREVFARLLPRAFRRPVKATEIQQLVALVASELEAGVDPQQSLKTGIVAMLCAPDFLFLCEPSQDSDAQRTLNDHELATRLSYFLWSSMPDGELTRLASEQKLHDPQVLERQVDRMLADSKVEGFVDGFARQWLKIDEFGRFPPDEKIYPTWYATDMAGIDVDVKQEPLAFFREVLRRDEPLSSFLDSDWLMLNERLAKLYGIADVQGVDLHRVALNRDDVAIEANRHRGGLLGMAGVHLWGADGNRTKPVERGKYILTVLFNDPPPPPPPNAGEVEPNLNGEKLTVRERLARHREQSSCNHCHRRIDPYGLAMENFNVIGQWREQLDGEKPLSHWGNDRPPINVSGTLPNGREFADFASFKAELVQQQDRFAGALCEKLLVYAIGRTVEPADRAEINRMLSKQHDAPTIRGLLKEIVTSDVFRTK